MASEVSSPFLLLKSFPLIWTISYAVIIVRDRDSPPQAQGWL